MHATLHRILSIIVVFILGLSLVLSTTTLAIDNKFLLTPDSSQLTTGGTIDVTVKAYIGNAVSNGSVSGTVTFPQNILSVATTSKSGTYGTFNISQSGGTINFNGTQNPGPTGIPSLFTITFRAVGAGAASVSVAGQINGAGAGNGSATYTVNSPPPTSCPAGQVGTPPNCSTPPPATCPTGQVGTPPNCSTPPPVETTPPPQDTSPDETTTPDTSGTIQNVTITTSYTSATITWGLNGAGATSSLLYGTESDKVTQPIAATKGADGTYTATIPNLIPGGRYYITINASNNGQTGVYSRTIVTQGYPVKLTVTQAKVPSPAAKITIGQQTYAATNDGSINLALAADTYSGTVTTTDGTSQQVSFTVAKSDIPTNGDAPKLQQFSFDLPAGQPVASTSRFSTLAFVGVIIVGFLLTAIGFFVFIMIRRRQLESGTSGSMGDQTSVIIDDGYNWEHHKDTIDSPATSPSVEQDTPHTNLNIQDEEPLDMFDQAKRTPPFPR